MTARVNWPGMKNLDLAAMLDDLLLKLSDQTGQATVEDLDALDEAITRLREAEDQE